MKITGAGRVGERRGRGEVCRGKVVEEVWREERKEDRAGEGQEWGEEGVMLVTGVAQVVAATVTVLHINPYR